jgi:hypothetical protein
MRRSRISSTVQPRTTEYASRSGMAPKIQRFMQHLMERLAAMFKALGNPEMTPDLKRKISEGVLQEAANHSVGQLAKEEDEMLLGLLRLRIQREGQSHRQGQRERVAARAS